MRNGDEDGGMKQPRDMTCVVGPPPVSAGRRGEMHHRRAAAAGVGVGEQGEEKGGGGQEGRAGDEERGQLVDDQRLIFRIRGSGLVTLCPVLPLRPSTKVPTLP